MSTSDILDWADVAGSGMAKAFRDYRRHGEVPVLNELVRTVSELQAVVEELRFRNGVI